MKRIIPFLFILVLLCSIVQAQHKETQLRHALELLIERAHAGDPKALFELSKLYDTGYDTIPQDTAKSKSLLVEAARKGYSPARNLLGFRYYNGVGIKKDIDSAIYWIRIAALDGDITAASNLGYLLSRSDEIPHDYPEAINWLTKAADASVPSALSQLADLKRQGLGCVADTLKAIELYEKASDTGDTDAQLKLLAMMGYKWKELSPDSALNLGLKYYIGNAPVAGVELLEQAAESNLPKALALLGDAYSKGKGVGYDHHKSIVFFYKAALEGDPSAQFIIAELLEFFPDAFKASQMDSQNVGGLSIIPYSDNPQYWYELAAENGVFDSETAYRILFTLP